MEDKVSIIVCAYNIENYIERCLKSLIEQSYTNIEIIVVEDGSTDKTLYKIEKICKLDNRVKVITQNNSGAIEARKKGYNISTGKYILFVDGDDWIELNCIEILYKNIKKYDLDILCYGFDYAYEDSKLNRNYYNSLGFEMIKQEKFIKDILLCHMPPSMWSKFIKKEFIEKNRIQFPNNITYAEDLAFSNSLAINMPKVGVLRENLYNYYQREGSITNNISEKIFDVAEATKFIKSQLEVKGIIEKYREEFEYCVYIHNFESRINNIYGQSKHAYSKKLFEKWNEFKIDITKNKYYLNTIKEASIIGKLVCNVKTKNYYIGTILNKLC